MNLKTTFKVMVASVVLSVLFVIVLVIVASNAPAPAVNPAIDVSEETQVKRREFLKKLISSDDNIIREITVSSTGTPVVHVGPAFLAGDFKDKQNIIGVVYGLYYRDDSSLVRIVDARTNKAIGYMTENRLDLED